MGIASLRLETECCAPSRLRSNMKKPTRHSKVSSNSRDFSGFFSFIMENFDQDIQLPDLGEATLMSPWTLCREFHKSYGISPMRWLWRFRTTLASECIRLVPDWQLTDISVLCGFSSLAHFSRQFRAHFGCTPSHYRVELTESSRKSESFRPQLIFDDLTVDHRDILESAIKKSLIFPQKAG
jgi:transcriptional regulator GlxA family with amidase domain